MLCFLSYAGGFVFRMYTKTEHRIQTKHNATYIGKKQIYNIHKKKKKKSLAGETNNKLHAKHKFTYIQQIHKPATERNINLHTKKSHAYKKQTHLQTKKNHLDTKTQIAYENKIKT